MIIFIIVNVYFCGGNKKKEREENKKGIHEFFTASTIAIRVSVSLSLDRDIFTPFPFLGFCRGVFYRERERRDGGYKKKTL